MVDGVCQFESRFLLRIVLYFSANGYGGLFFRYLGGADEDAVGAVVRQIEVLLGYCRQPYIAVDAAKESEITRNRRDIHSGIVHTDSQCVGFSGGKERRDVEGAGSISPRMFVHLFSVYIDGGCLTGCVQLQEYLFPFPAAGDMDGTAIPSGATVIIFFRISIGVPSVGQMDAAPLTVVEGAV